MQYRVPLNFIGNGYAHQAYGGKLEAWSYKHTSAEEWFSEFRNDILQNIGKRYLPVYRMADGEYRFLMGRKYNLHRKPLWREIIAVTAEKIYLKNPNNWKTSWGEKYDASNVSTLKNVLIENIRKIAQNGYLACYINDNGLNAFTEYNKSIENYFLKRDIKFSENNYVPFHFVCHLLMEKGAGAFFQDRNILIITGKNKDKVKITDTLKKLGVRSVQYCSISDTSSMEDVISIDRITLPIDLCFVAAGIGSANIITQLCSLNTVVLDIGGYIHCFADPNVSIHGDVFKLIQ